MSDNRPGPGDASNSEAPSQCNLNLDESHPAPRHRVSWLGVFATTVLCLVAANIAFGAVCTATFFLARQDTNSNNSVLFTGLFVAAVVALATFAGLFSKFVIPKWRGPRHSASTPRDIGKR